MVARFAEGIAVAIERGTPLAGVLHAQAADVREAGRRALIESGARKEILMMVPVVFLVLPVTVVFAFWPGVVGLHLVTPDDSLDRMEAHEQLTSADSRSTSRVRDRGRRDERGDVPGWVLITVMTAGWSAALWALAGPQLQDMLRARSARQRLT